MKAVSEDAIVGILCVKEKNLGSNSLGIWNQVVGFKLKSRES